MDDQVAGNEYKEYNILRSAGMAENREMPQSDNEKITQMWTVLIGLNGTGLISQFKEVREDVDAIKRNMVTTQSCHLVQDRRNKKRLAGWVTAERLTLLIIAILGALAGFGVFGG